MKFAYTQTSWKRVFRGILKITYHYRITIYKELNGGNINNLMNKYLYISWVIKEILNNKLIL